MSRNEGCNQKGLKRDSSFEERVLFVFTEDKKIKQDLTRLFNDQLYEVECCGSVFNILEIIMSCSIQVGIIDVGKPSKLILDIISLITRVRPNMLLITISEQGYEAQVRKAVKDRLYRFFAKPVSREELNSAVKKAFKIQFQPTT